LSHDPIILIKCWFLAAVQPVFHALGRSGKLKTDNQTALIKQIMTIDYLDLNHLGEKVWI